MSPSNNTVITKILETLPSGLLSATQERSSNFTQGCHFFDHSSDFPSLAPSKSFTYLKIITIRNYVSQGSPEKTNQQDIYILGIYSRKASNIIQLKYESLRTNKADGVNPSLRVEDHRQTERDEFSLHHLFVLFSPSLDLMMPTHSGEGNVLY